MNELNESQPEPLERDEPVLAPRHPHHNKLLLLISAFKVGQALLFALIGLGALRLVGKDVGDILLRLANHLRFNPESKLINLVLEKASLVDDRMLHRIEAVGFIYAALDLLEGIGLYLEKTWAEYLTLLVTGSFLPWEVYEVAHRVTLIRVGLLGINALVFVYLVKLVSQRRSAHGRG